MPVQIGAKAHSFLDPTGLLSDCHRRIEMFLGSLQSVAEIIDRPLTAETRAALESVLRYFRESAPKHTADDVDTVHTGPLRCRPGRGKVWQSCSGYFCWPSFCWTWWYWASVRLRGGRSLLPGWSLGILPWRRWRTQFIKGRFYRFPRIANSPAKSTSIFWKHDA